MTEVHVYDNEAWEKVRDQYDRRSRFRPCLCGTWVDIAYTTPYVGPQTTCTACILLEFADDAAG